MRQQRLCDDQSSSRCRLVTPLWTKAQEAFREMAQKSAHNRSVRARPETPGVERAFRPIERYTKTELLQLLRSVLNALPERVFIKDRQGRYVLDNLSHRRFVGAHTHDDIAGCTSRDFFDDSVAAAFAIDDHDVIGGRNIVAKKEQVGGPHDEPRWIETSKIALHGPQGAPSHVLGVSRDVTQQVRTAQALERELAAARTIQQRFTPASHPPIPNLEVAGVYQPASDVGGDYLDYFRTADGRWVVFIADVCGKGAAAALLMAVVRTLVRVEAGRADGAASLLSAVNEGLQAHLDERSFVTALCLIIDIDGREMTYARAGHPPLMRVSHTDGSVVSVAPRGIALGLVRESRRFRAQLEELRLPLVTGDVHFLYTDGVTEGANACEERFGYARLEHTLASAVCMTSAQRTVDAVLDSVGAFCDGVAQHDDMTMAAMVVR